MTIVTGHVSRGVRLRWLPVLLTTSLMCAATVAFADDEAAPAAPASAPGAAPQGVETLVITGERRETNLQTTGVSASVLTGKDLEDKSVYGLTALQYAAPSLTISDFGSANVLNIRGVGKSQVDVDLPSGVQIYRDGAPTITSYFQNERYYDMAGIEVLRGPQGTFSGKSASGGSITIRTRNPDLGRFDGYAEVIGGDYNEYGYQGALNVPLGDTAAIRIATDQYMRDSYVDMPNNCQDESGASGCYRGTPGDRTLRSYRIGFLWNITDQLEVITKSDVSDLDYGGNPAAGSDDLIKQPRNHDLYHIVIPFSEANDFEGRYNYRDRSERHVVNVKYHFDNGITVSSISGYQDIDTLNNLPTNETVPPPAFFQFYSKAKLKLYSQEFDVISPEDQKLTWVVGAFVDDQKFRVPPFQHNGFGFVGGGPVPGPFDWLSTPWDDEEKDARVFAHVGYKFTDKLEVQLGSSYSRYDRRQDTHWLLGLGSVPLTAPILDFGEVNQGLDQTSTDWNFTVNYQLTDEHFLYGVISRGHTVGGMNLFPPNGDFDESGVFNYELGWKANLFDNHLHTQLNGYYETMDNYQAAFSQPLSGGVNATGAFHNASGESKIWGGEFSAQAVFGNLEGDIGVAYLDSELGTFKDVMNPFTGALVDLSGAKSPFTPKWTGNVGVQYAIHLPWDMTLTPRADFAYADNAQAGLWNSPRITLEERKITNLQLRLDGHQWYVVGAMTNATDEKFAGGIQNNGTLYYPAPPRMWNVRVGYQFGGG